MMVDVHEVRGCLCLHTRRAARHLTQIYDEALRESGLRVTQFQLLAAVGEMEPVMQQALARLMGMDRTTLTRNLALLQRDGLVEIEVGSKDRRERNYRLTAAGMAAVMRGLPLWRAAQERLAGELVAGDGVISATGVLGLMDRLSAVGGGAEE